MPWTALNPKLNASHDAFISWYMYQTNNLKPYLEMDHKQLIVLLLLIEICGKNMAPSFLKLF